MTSRFVRNPALFRELARGEGVRDLVKDRADRGARRAAANAPVYAGPTYMPGVQRAGEYRSSIYSAATLRPTGWRAEFGATAPWSMQVEYGTGRPETSRERPQTGRSPKQRPLMRALLSMRES